MINEKQIFTYDLKVPIKVFNLALYFNRRAKGCATAPANVSELVTHNGEFLSHYNELLARNVTN